MWFKNQIRTALYNLYLALMRIIYLSIAFLFVSFQPSEEKKPFIIVLGIAQDAGYPQIGCNKDCCKKAVKQLVSCIAIADPVSNQKWIIDATPDFPEQLRILDRYQSGNLSGIFLTHAHMGHYTGLMYLGREAMNANKVPVYTMPRMQDYLKSNGPWSQLVTLNNIELRKLKADSVIQLNERISVQPLLVPHRDEFSETVGYLIQINKQSVLFIPDIDKWNKWEKGIVDYVKQCDYLLLDGTFYKEGELKGRNMAEIPHPFVQESMELFDTLSPEEKKKVWFIHFNHTNPLVRKDPAACNEVKNNGFNTAIQGQLFHF
ncbi:MAG TPA: MBL fold metallo-hydrolase [Chitinophagaceae bacterium]|nr:MBL fold metallo-hydrolase [Chitinophagaceae bacterium]